MIARRWEIVVSVLTVALYAGAIVAGLRVRDFSSINRWRAPDESTAWIPPKMSSIPAGLKGDSIRRGALIFDQTPLYAAQYTGARVSCSDCHAGGGIQPFASPVLGLPALFPMYNQRAGHVISLKDRIQECFVRSENGRPIPYKGPTMQALVDYIDWLSQPEPLRKPFVGRGLITLPDLRPDPYEAALSTRLNALVVTGNMAKEQYHCCLPFGDPTHLTMGRDAQHRQDGTICPTQYAPEPYGHLVPSRRLRCFCLRTRTAKAHLQSGLRGLLRHWYQ
jgi:hypothetical protein